MKVVFCNLPWFEYNEQEGRYRMGVRGGSRWGHTFRSMSQPGNFVFGDYRPYPMFLGYATTYAAKHTDAQVLFRDSIALAETWQGFVSFIAAEVPDMVFIESTTPSWENDRTMIGAFNELFPTIKICVVGTIVTSRAAEILALTGVVAAIQGEYEKGSVRVINGQTGLILRELLTREEMNAAPFPYYDKSIAHRYADHNPLGQIHPHAQVWSSRGCAFKCTHCEWPATMTGDDPDGMGKRTVRQYSEEYLEAFIRHLVSEYGFRSIYWDDDTVNLGNRHIEKLCRVMVKIGLPWSAMCRIDTIDRDHWKLMRDSGCFGVKIGYESGSQYVVDQLIKKGLNLVEARETTIYLKSLGFTIHGTFMSGVPGETREQMQQTLDYIKSLPLDTYQHSGMAELEGAPVHTLRERGEMQDANYTRENDGVKAIEHLLEKMRSE
jgi:radical SAM superfamily enzyme YgiQ (UPF0313 family)